MVKAGMTNLGLRTAGDGQVEFFSAVIPFPTVFVKGGEQYDF
jgi:hypothetical protein